MKLHRGTALTARGRIALLVAALALSACAETRQDTVAETPESTCGGCHEAATAPTVPTAPHESHQQYACEECHVVPAHWADEGHLEDRGVDDVVFGALATRDGATPTWDGQTCRSVYCHGGTMDRGDAGLGWAEPLTELDCGSCHAALPAPPHPQEASDCRVCHAEALDADGNPLPEKHVDGNMDLIEWTGAPGQPECGVCHLAPPAPPHIQSADCEECHIEMIGGLPDPAFHLDGEVQVLDWTAAEGQPACGECHGIPPAAPHFQEDDCSLCHEGVYLPEGNVVPEAHMNGAVDVVRWTSAPGQAACGECHSVPPAAPHPQGMSDCQVCHAEAYDAAGELDPDVHVDGHVQLLRWTGAPDQPTCGTCHEVPPTEHHPSEDMGPCSLCHGEAYDADGELNPDVHMDGELQKIRWDNLPGQPACGECHSAPPPDPHPWGMGPCSNCHGEAYDAEGDLDPDLHVDGDLQIITWTGAEGQPACGDCHSIPPGGDHPEETDCISCHSAAYAGPGELDTEQHIDGEVDFGGGK